MAYLPLSVHEQKEHLIYNPNRHYDACIAAARISPDGEYLAVGYDDGNVCLWKTPFDWVSLHKVWSHATRAADLGVTDIAFTSDSQRVISIGFDGVAMVWDTGSGDKVSEWRDDRAGALAVEAKLAVSNDDNIAVNTATYPEPDSLGLVFWYVESGMEVERAPIRAEPRKVTVNPTRGQVLTVGPAAVLWQTPLVDSGALLQACRAVLPRAMLDSERKRYGLSGESYSWQRELWPYTDPVTLWKERMLLSFGSLYAVVISTLRSRLARLTAMGIQGTSDQLYVYASAILDSYQRELSAGLDDLYPFSHDLAKLLDLLGYCWDETMNFVMQAGDIDGARRILSEYKGPSGTTYDQVVKQLNVRQSAQ